MKKMILILIFIFTACSNPTEDSSFEDNPNYKKTILGKWDCIFYSEWYDAHSGKYGFDTTFQFLAISDTIYEDYQLIMWQMKDKIKDDWYKLGSFGFSIYEDLYDLGPVYQSYEKYDDGFDRITVHLLNKDSIYIHYEHRWGLMESESFLKGKRLKSYKSILQ